MADFPWQKPDGEGNEAPRFPWQRPESSDDTESRDASPAPAADEVPAAGAHTRDGSDLPSAPEVRAAAAPEDDNATGATAPGEDQEREQGEIADAPPGAEPEQRSSEPASGSMPWHEAAADAPDQSLPEPDGTDVPPSTFTPPWRPEQPRPSAKRPRPTPRDPAPQPAETTAPAHGRAGSRAARVAGVATLAAVAGAILIAVGAALFVPGRGSGDPPRASSTPTVVPLAANEIAMDTATTFVDAVVSGNAGTALAMLGTASSPLTTDEAWRAMIEAHPITDVNVVALGEDTWHMQRVDVGYTMNDSRIDFTMSIDVDVADPENVAIDLDLPTLDITDGYEGFDITINGVALDDPGAASYDVFPGSYTVATTTPYFEIAPDPIVASESIVFLYPYEHEPTLTGDGVAKFREAVRASAEACVGSTTLDAGCGLEVTGGLEGGGSLVDGTVERSLTDEQWAEIDAMEPKTSSFDGAMIQEGDMVGSVTFYADWQQNGYSGRDEIHGGPWLYTPHVDFSDPDLPVTWE